MEESLHLWFGKSSALVTSPQNSQLGTALQQQSGNTSQTCMSALVFPAHISYLSRHFPVAYRCTCKIFKHMKKQASKKISEAFFSVNGLHSLTLACLLVFSLILTTKPILHIVSSPTKHVIPL